MLPLHQGHIKMVAKVGVEPTGQSLRGLNSLREPFRHSA
jgi:hypothetical protein